jgi:TatD DNase family protein
MLIDSHCHIHDEQFFPDNREEVYKRAVAAGVRMIAVGTSEADSRAAVEFAAAHEGVWAAVGVHPHEAKEGWGSISNLAGPASRSAPKIFTDYSKTFLGAAPPTVTRGFNDAAKVVAIGEIGLDYHYSHSPREAQVEALQAQIEVALRHNLPIIFHVRDAFDDFWPIFDNFHGIRGVLHSFTDTEKNLEEGLKRDLFIGVNGISTFTKDQTQQAMFQAVPLDRLLLETDAPFLTPVPFRGRVNEPAYVREVARHQATIRDIPFDDIVAITATNAEALFALR